MKEFYKFSVNYDECGLGVWLSKYFSLHETPCYHYCVDEFSKVIIRNERPSDGESIAAFAKRKGVKIHKIHKTHSRKAFDTKEKAYNNFMYLKGLQLTHLQRDIKVIKELLRFNKDYKYSDLIDQGHSMLMPSTKSFVDENITFD
tara:strand:- start:23762 stop:24196 length:435 start_codon:yes stop_codon:yes gene_type:complete